MSGTRPNPKFVRLSHAWCNNCISKEDFADLESMLQTDADSRAFFFEMAQLNGALRWHYTKHQEKTPCNDNEPIIGHASPHNAVNQTTVRSTGPIERWANNQTLPLSLMLAGAALGLILVLLAIFEVPNQVAKSRIQNANDFPIVAQITNSHRTVWGKENANIMKDWSLRKDQRIVLESGIMEISFYDGSTALLEGPVEFVVNSYNKGTLHSGKMFVRVPPRAIGFRIDTPQARILDLGTEFGAHVSEETGTFVRVIEGKIELSPRDPDRPSAPLRVEAGQVVLISKTDDISLKKVPKKLKKRFIKELPQQRPDEGQLLVTKASSLSVATFTASKNDLVNAGSIALEAVHPIGYEPVDGNFPFTHINDGLSLKSPNRQGLFESEAMQNDRKWAIDFVLNTEQHNHGYDVTQIDSIAAWPNERAQQRISISYNTVTNSEFVFLGTFENDDTYQGSTRIQITRRTGLVAIGVKTIRLEYTQIHSRYTPVIQEVDIFGKPSAR